MSNTIEFEKADPSFSGILKQITGRCLLPPPKVWHLFSFAKHTSSMIGEIAEVGVFRGGGAKVICSGSPNKTLHLFDTFEGMPETDKKLDIHKKGDFSATSLESVKKFLNGHKVVFHKGLFPATAKGVNGQFCFVHVDVDIHSSTKAACEFFYPKMTNGGIMLFDDYGARSCPGAKKAVDDYFSDKGQVIMLATGQALKII